MPQVCDLNHSFPAVSEYHIFKDNVSKFPRDINIFKDNISKFPRDIHYNESHLIICCTGVNMKAFSLH